MSSQKDEHRSVKDLGKLFEHIAEEHHGSGPTNRSQKPKINVDLNHVKNRKQFFEQVQTIENGKDSKIGLSKLHSKSTHHINSLYNNKSSNLNGHISKSTEMLDSILNRNDEKYTKFNNHTKISNKSNKLLFDINNEENKRTDKYYPGKYQKSSESDLISFRKQNTLDTDKQNSVELDIQDIENCISYVNNELSSINYIKPDQPKWTVLDFAKQQKIDSTFSDLADIEDEFGTLLDIDNDFCVETFNNGNENVLFKIHLGRELYSNESVYSYVPIISDINYGDAQEEIYYTVATALQEEAVDYEKPEYCFIENSLYEEEKNHMSGTFFDKNQNPRIEIIGTDINRNSFMERLQASKSQKLIIKELLDTEETYLTNLKYVIDYYIEHFRNSEDQPDINLVFGNIEEIYDETEKFYNNMQDCTSIDEIAMAFINNAEIFDFYTRYLRNKPKSNRYIYNNFNKLLKQRQEELDDQYSWDSHLLTPVQRPGRYKLLLEKIRDSLIKSGEKSELLDEAIALVDKKITEANTLMTIDSIQNCPHSLEKMGQFLLKETFNLKKKYRSTMFLFEKILILCVENDSKSELFEYIESIPMDKLSIKHSNKSMSFQLTNFDKSRGKKNAKYEFVVEAPSMVIKDKWVDEIQRLLWVQLQFFKDQQMKSATHTVDGAINTRTFSNIINGDTTVDGSINIRSFSNSINDNNNMYEEVHCASLNNEEEEYVQYEEIKEEDEYNDISDIYDGRKYDQDDEVLDVIIERNEAAEEQQNDYENILYFNNEETHDDNADVFENSDDAKDPEDSDDYKESGYYQIIQSNTYDEERDHLRGTFFDKDVNPRIEILRSESSEEHDTLLRNIPITQYMIIKELIETEETYVSKMKHIIEDYLVHFRTAEIPSDINIVFGNIEELYTKTESLLANMKLCGSVEEISKVFLKNTDIFDLYTEYMRNKPMSYYYANTKFKQLIKDRQIELEDNYTCDSYLLNPIQRPGRYKLLLEKLQKELNKTGEACKSLNEAVKLLREKITGANTMMMIDSIEGCPIDLHKVGEYIMKDTFNIKRKYRSAIFLFKDIVIFCEESHHDKYKYMDSIEMKKLSLSHKRTSTSFQLRNFDKSRLGDESKYVFDIDTPSFSIKEKWVEEIQRLLWDQLKYFKDQQKVADEAISTSTFTRKRSLKHKSKASPSQKRSSSTFYYDIPT